MSNSDREEGLSNQQVYASTAAIIESLNKEFGTPKVQIVDKVMRFVAAQSKAFRRELLAGGDPAGELVRTRMAEMAVSGQETVGPLSFEDAVKLMRTALERLETIELARRREIENLQNPKRKR
jgi:hypothetical protein